MSTTIPAKWQAKLPWFQGILRIMVAATYMTHGTAKLFAWPYPIMPDGSTASLMSQVGVAGVLETFGGTLLLVGLCTRPVAFFLAGEMAVAYFQFHFPNSPWPWANNGELPYLFCFIWLFFSAAGPGALSLDSLRDRRS